MNTRLEKIMELNRYKEILLNIKRSNHDDHDKSGGRQKVLTLRI